MDVLDFLDETNSFLKSHQPLEQKGTKARTQTNEKGGCNDFVGTLIEEARQYRRLWDSSRRLFKDIKKNHKPGISVNISVSVARFSSTTVSCVSYNQ